MCFLCPNSYTQKWFWGGGGDLSDRKFKSLSSQPWTSSLISCSSERFFSLILDLLPLWGECKFMFSFMSFIKATSHPSQLSSRREALHCLRQREGLLGSRFLVVHRGLALCCLIFLCCTLVPGLVPDL